MQRAKSLDHYWAMARSVEEALLRPHRMGRAQAGLFYRTFPPSPSLPKQQLNHSKEKASEDHISASERMKENKGVKALIVGPAGVGKTTLLRTHRSQIDPVCRSGGWRPRRTGS
jgi:ATPase subunit of ABC transporter with duplicated ATPase domains